MADLASCLKRLSIPSHEAAEIKKSVKLNPNTNMFDATEYMDTIRAELDDIRTELAKGGHNLLPVKLNAPEVTPDPTTPLTPEQEIQKAEFKMQRTFDNRPDHWLYSRENSDYKGKYVIAQRGFASATEATEFAKKYAKELGIESEADIFINKGSLNVARPSIFTRVWDSFRAKTGKRAEGNPNEGQVSVIQRYFNSLRGLEKMTMEATKARRKTLTELGMSKKDIDIIEQHRNDPVQLANQAYNTRNLTNQMVNEHGFKVVEDQYGNRQIVVDESAEPLVKHLVTLANHVNESADFKAAGIDANKAVQEWSALALAKRIHTRYRLDGTRKGDVEEALKFIKAQSHFQEKAYTEMDKNFMKFNDMFREMLVGLGYISREDKDFSDAFGLFMPIRKTQYSTIGDGADIAQGSYHKSQSKVVRSKSDTSRQYMSASDEERTTQFFDPLQGYMQLVFSTMQHATNNHAKLRMLNLAKEAGPDFFSQVYERVNVPEITKPEVESALEAKGIDIDLSEFQDWTKFIPMVTDELWRNGDLEAVVNNGKLEIYKVKDAALLDSLRTLRIDFAHAVNIKDSQSRIAPLLNFSTQYNRTNERIITTYDFGWYMTTALTTDAITSSIFDPSFKNWPGLNILEGAFYLTKDKIMTGGAAYKEFMRTGGMSGLKHPNSYFGEGRRTLAKAGIDKDIATFGSRPGDDSDFIEKLERYSFGRVLRDSWLGVVGDYANSASAMFENMVRFAAYKRQLKAGKTQADAALNASSYSINFRMRGSDDVVTAYQRALGPFLKATMTALYQTGRNFNPNSYGNTKAIVAARVAKLSLFTAGAMLSWYGMNGIHMYEDNQEDWMKNARRYYQSLNPEQRSMYMYFPVPFGENNILRVRIPDGLRLPYSAISESLNQMGTHPETRDFLLAMSTFTAGQMLQTAYMDNAGVFLPPIAKVPIGLATNNQEGFSLGDGIPIRPEAVGGQPMHPSPYLNYEPATTSRTGIEIATTMRDITGINASPADYEYILRNVFFSLSSYAIDATDYILAASEGEYKGSWQNAPVAKQLFPGQPVRRSAHASEFWAISAEIDKMKMMDATIGFDRSNSADRPNKSQYKDKRTGETKVVDPRSYAEWERIERGTRIMGMPRAEYHAKLAALMPMVEQARKDLDKNREKIIGMYSDPKAKKEQLRELYRQEAEYLKSFNEAKRRVFGTENFAEKMVEWYNKGE